MPIHVDESLSLPHTLLACRQPRHHWSGVQKVAVGSLEDHLVRGAGCMGRRARQFARPAAPAPADSRPLGRGARRPPAPSLPHLPSARPSPRRRAFVGKSFARSLDKARFTFFSADLPKGDLIRYQAQLAACSPVRLLDLAALNKVRLSMARTLKGGRRCGNGERRSWGTAAGLLPALPPVRQLSRPTSWRHTSAMLLTTSRPCRCYRCRRSPRRHGSCLPLWPAA